MALLVVLAPSCDPAPPATGESSPESAPVVKKPPPRISLDARALRLGEHHTAIPRPVAQDTVAELGDALRALREVTVPQTGPWLVEVDPGTPAELLSALVTAADWGDVKLAYADVGSSTGLEIAARKGQKEPLKCNETGVAVGRGMTWISRFAMFIDSHGARRSHPPDLKEGILAYLDNPDPASCRRLGGRPEHIDLAALSATVAAMTPEAPVCGPVRVAVHREIEWSRFAGLLRKLGEAGTPPVLIDHGQSQFAGCGTAAFIDGPAFDLYVSDKQGPLEDSAIDQVATNHGPETDACLALEPPRPLDSQQPHHHVLAEIGPDGRVLAATPKDPRDPVATCLAAAVSTWTFPKPRAATSTVKFTLGY